MHILLLHWFVNYDNLFVTAYAVRQNSRSALFPQLSFTNLFIDHHFVQQLKLSVYFSESFCHKFTLLSLKKHI